MKNALEFLLHSDIEPKNISCRSFYFRTGDFVNYAKCGREKNIIHLMLRGQREYVFDGMRSVFDAHSVIFIPDGTNYTTTAYASEGETCDSISLFFSLDPSLSKRISHGVYRIETFEKSALVNRFFELEEICATMPTQILRQKILALEIMLEFVSQLGVPNAKDAKLIAPALHYIAEHYREQQPIARYAQACNMSESYFRKKFSEVTGLSPVLYRDQLRFDEAMTLYQKGYTMKAIAEEVGFCDENYFSKLYKQRNGKRFKEDIERV